MAVYQGKATQQGFDPTATTVDSKEDRISFLTAIRSHVQLQLGLDPEANEEELNREIDRHHYPRVATRLTIEDHDVWVSRPLWVSPAIVGRCTAGYWGVRCGTKGVVFVKDIWRTNVEDVVLEGDAQGPRGEGSEAHPKRAVPRGCKSQRSERVADNTPVFNSFAISTPDHASG